MIQKLLLLIIAGALTMLFLIICLLWVKLEMGKWGYVAQLFVIFINVAMFCFAATSMKEYFKR